MSCVLAPRLLTYGSNKSTQTQRSAFNQSQPWGSSSYLALPLSRVSFYFLLSLKISSFAPAKNMRDLSFKDVLSTNPNGSIEAMLNLHPKHSLCSGHLSTTPPRALGQTGVGGQGREMLTDH